MVNKKRVGMMVAVTLLTGVLLFCSVFFLVRRANREITQRSFDELATATRQIAKDLVDAANADQTILSAMAELIAGHDERDNDAVLRIMKSFSLSETFVSTVALLRPDGTLLLTDGTRYDVSDTFDFETEAARGAYISDRVTSYFAPEKLVVCNVVPVVRDGETVAILYGVVLLQELSRNYQIDLYNGNAFLLLVDGNNGDILLDTWHDSLGNISELRGRKMLKGYTYEEAMEKNPQRHRRRYVHRIPLHGADALPALRAGRHQQLERRARRERGGGAGGHAQRGADTFDDGDHCHRAAAELSWLYGLVSRLGVARRLPYEHYGPGHGPDEPCRL